MSDRGVLKRIIQFGKREFSTKRPASLKVLLVKSKSVSSFGFLPNLVYLEHGPVHYLVAINYREHLRIYFFNRNGTNLGAKNFEKDDKLLQDLPKMTVLKYSLPRPKLK
jgi:hypothetical protein